MADIVSIASHSGLPLLLNTFRDVCQIFYKALKVLFASLTISSYMEKTRKNMINT